MLGDLPEYADEEVCSAAFEVERFVQARLNQFGGNGGRIGDEGCFVRVGQREMRVPLRVSRQLWDAQWQAHEAVFAAAKSRKGRS
jgi:hypothetical protein